MINTSELISTHQLTQRHERFTSRRQRGGRAVTVYSHSSTGCWGRKTTEPSTFSRVQCSDQNRAEGINPVCCRVRVRCQCLSGSQVWCDSDMSCSRVSGIDIEYLNTQLLSASAEPEPVSVDSVDSGPQHHCSVSVLGPETSRLHREQLAAFILKGWTEPGSVCGQTCLFSCFWHLIQQKIHRNTLMLVNL